MNVGSEDLTLGDVDQDIPLKESKENIVGDIIDTFGKDYRCLIAARKAHTQDSCPHLFILAIHDDKAKCEIEDKAKCEIYVITFNPLDWIYINDTETIEGQMKNTEINEVLRKYKNVVMKNINDPKLSKKDAVDIGKELFETLIPYKIKTRLQDELKNKSEKVEWWVWIYSDDDVFKYIWEWLYASPESPNNTKQSNVANYETTDKNSSGRWGKLFHSKKREQKPKNKLLQESTMQQVKKNNKEDGFFWGDQFFLVRVPKKYEFKKLSFNIHKIANIIITRDCRKYEDSYYDCLKSRVSAKRRSKDLDHVDDVKNFDHIHVVADASSDKIGDKVDVSPSLENVLLNPNFVFLNIFTSGKIKTFNLRSKLIKIIPANTMMCPSFSILPEVCAAEKFTESFSASVVDEKNVVKAATKARYKIRQDNDSDLWRLVYIVEGNPFTEAEE